MTGAPVDVVKVAETDMIQAVCMLGMCRQHKSTWRSCVPSSKKNGKERPLLLRSVIQTEWSIFRDTGTLEAPIFKPCLRLLAEKVPLSSLISGLQTIPGAFCALR